MKLMRFTLTLHFLFCLSTIQFSQGNNSGNIEPVQVCPPISSLCVEQLTPSPTISVTSDLVDSEYVIVNQSVMATNGSGPAIIGIDDDGIFIPSSLGVMPGSTIDIIPISYNLAELQSTMDDVLKGTFLFFSCCSLAGTTCTDLNNAGIFCGSDVTSLADLSALFGSADTLLSINDFISEISNTNAQLQDPNIPASCGGGDFISYAYGNACSYTIYDDIEILNAPNHSANELVERSDYIQSGALVPSPLVVDYYGGNYVELVSPFEVQLGGEFLADILVCP